MLFKRKGLKLKAKEQQQWYFFACKVSLPFFRNNSFWASIHDAIFKKNSAHIQRKFLKKNCNFFLLLIIFSNILLHIKKKKWIVDLVGCYKALHNIFWKIFDFHLFLHKTNCFEYIAHTAFPPPNLLQYCNCIFSYFMRKAGIQVWCS